MKEIKPAAVFGLTDRNQYHLHNVTHHVFIQMIKLEPWHDNKSFEAQTNYLQTQDLISQVG